MCRAEGEEAKNEADVKMSVPKERLVRSGVGMGNDMDVIAVPCEFEQPREGKGKAGTDFVLIFVRRRFPLSRR